MRFLILGSGTSTGVPLPGCKCETCNSTDPKDSRNRTSAALILDSGQTILIDTSPDLRHQVKAFGIKTVDAVVYTHYHADHILGFEDLRPFNFLSKKAIPIFATQETLSELSRFFSYVFSPSPEYEGGLLTQVVSNSFNFESEFQVIGVRVIPLRLLHGSMIVAGFRIGDLAYCTDCNSVPDETLKKLKGVKTLILDALRWTKDGSHKTHFSVEQAIEVAREVGAERTYLTHMTHSILHERDSKMLPPGISFAYDGLEIAIGSP